MRRVTGVATAAALALLVAVTLRAAPAPPPALVVIIVVDQMRADYIDSFKADWTGGLKRMITDGAWFSQAAYPYLTTVTCPGHATVGTGAFPHRHGVFQNAWWDRETAAQTACTADASATPVTLSGKPGTGGDSARTLRTPTLADEMRAQKSAHVAAISLKARSALMLAGHGGDGVIWLNDALDGWQGSSLTPPAEAVAKAFIAENSIDADYGKAWAKMLPDARYHHPDDGLGENPPRGWTATFPHLLTSASGAPDAEYHARWERSPFADAYIGRFAAAIVDGLQLGKHETTDVLAISFSSPDLVGHAFGPRSQETQDIYAQLDRTIGALFDRLDAAVGKGKYVVALTADHGVTPIAEQLITEGRDAGRLDARAVSAAAETAAGAALGPGQYVARENGNDLYFSPGVFERLVKTPGALDRVAAAIAGVPGIQRVFKPDDIRDAARAVDPLQRAAALSYVPGRSGDLILAPKRGWEFIGAGATHGTANPDDQRVPVVLMGAGIRRGRFKQAATPADIAPTLASLAGVLLPHAEGRVLREALSQ
jgi:predicted AlkP superfamily pyrophosphatase or phosphodiesterase